MKPYLRNTLTLFLVSLLLLATACGTGSEGNGSGAESVKKETPGPTRTVKSLKGDIQVPSSPKRVIGLSVVYPEFLSALGVTPVAIQNYHQDFPSYLKTPFKNTLKMGIGETPNFEAILSAAPDLIIAPVWWADKVYDQLSKIAPTVLLPEREDWRDELRDIGEALDKKDIADKAIADYEKQTADAKRKLHEAAGNDTVMYMMVMSKELVVYGENQSRGAFLHKELDLKPVSGFPKNELSVSISLEKLPEYNPDHIILQLDDSNDKEAQKKYQELQESAVWKNLKAVQNKRVYFMDGIEWFSVGMSLLANRNAIDDVLQAFQTKKQ
ncbi:iron-siderophore ABC transporter substrate-binding protein [Paenibacillus sp. MBLB4367]|uniref:iron-siderophore ABC transporter substrate-binding protein n=1 Tax=Paenibacillus sp. MBLB4367 TaxID=3384767 RepID=UPI0039081191